AIQQEEYLELIKANGFKAITIQKEKSIHVPDDILSRYLDPEEIRAFRQSGTGIHSITVYAEKAADAAACCGADCCS
ncbi:MAG: arsenite S-adenosylmethyltransferase, partial [Bacteroidota bacterium]